MITVPLLTLAISLSTAVTPPPPDPFFAEDKVKHFFASFVVTSISASAARFAGLDHRTSLVVGAGVGVGAGILKEVQDARAGTAPSYRDILWDLAGIGSAAAVLDLTR